MIFKSSDFTTTKNDVSFLEAGIHENVMLVGARTEKSVNGNNFIEITFTKDGQSLKHTEFEPSTSPNITQEHLDEKKKNIGTRLMDILKCFYSVESLGFEGEFDAFLIWVAALVNSADKSKSVRLKAIYNDRGYVTLPSYKRYTFIEPMTVTQKDSKIKKLSIDKFERPITDKEETSSDSATMFTNSGSVASGTNGMPF